MEDTVHGRRIEDKVAAAMSGHGLTEASSIAEAVGTPTLVVGFFTWLYRRLHANKIHREAQTIQLAETLRLLRGEPEKLDDSGRVEEASKPGIRAMAIELAMVRADLTALKETFETHLHPPHGNVDRRAG